MTINQNKAHAREVRRTANWVFALALILSFFLFIKPALFTMRSRNWVAVPCVIRYENKTESPSSLKIIYDYQVANRFYTGRRLYSSDSDRRISDWKREYYEGKKTSCWVNPRHPHESTLTWGWGFQLLFSFAMCFCMFAFAIYSYIHPENVNVKSAS